MGVYFLVDQFLRVLRGHGRMVVDYTVTPRKGRGRIFELIVTPPPVTHQIYDNIFHEMVPPIRGDLPGENDRLWIIGVDVYHRDTQSLGNI